MLIFRKIKVLLVTNFTIYFIDKKRKRIKRRNKIDELTALTRSLFQGSNNLVLHFSTRGDEELICEK